MGASKVRYIVADRVPGMAVNAPKRNTLCILAYLVLGLLIVGLAAENGLTFDIGINPL